MIFYLFLIFTCINAFNNSFNLPPISKIYKSSIYIPFLGKQNIEYERLEELKSIIRLNGFVNKNGYINYIKEDNNLYSGQLDNTLINLLNKYKCILDDPFYDETRDIAIIKIKIKLLNFNKKLVLVSGVMPPHDEY